MVSLDGILALPGVQEIGHELADPRGQRRAGEGVGVEGVVPHRAEQGARQKELEKLRWEKRQ